MSIFITGDTHGNLDIAKFKPRCFDYDGLTRDDFMIILGDFALPWTAPGKSQWKEMKEAYWLDWLDNKPWTTLFIDGNHENHDLLDSMPVDAWHGGDAHFVRDNVIHLMRGQIFDIDGFRFFTMGGAESIDKHLRYPGESWWEQELPNDDEMNLAMENLRDCGMEVDFILTHEAPARAKIELGMRRRDYMDVGFFENWLQYNIAEQVSFRQWFFGHHHVDYPEMRPFTPLYNVVYDISLGGPSSRIIISDEDDDIPEPAHEHGYTKDEIREISGASEEEVKAALALTMNGSTVAVSPEGEILYYRSDVLGRILPAL